MKRLIFTALAASLILTGCGPKISNNNLRFVKADMSSKQVESILGQPTRIEQDHALRTQEVVTLPVTRYIYEQQGQKVELTFVEDQLASGGVRGSFDPPDASLQATSPTPNP